MIPVLLTSQTFPNGEINEPSFGNTLLSYIITIRQAGDVGQLRNPSHDDLIKWKHFPRYWPFVRRITGLRWIPRTKASDAEPWWVLWSAPN